MDRNVVQGEYREASTWARVERKMETGEGGKKDRQTDKISRNITGETKTHTVISSSKEKETGTERGNRQADRQTNQQTNEQTDKRTDRQTNRQTNKPTDRQTNQQTDRQTNRKTAF